MQPLSCMSALLKNSSCSGSFAKSVIDGGGGAGGTGVSALLKNSSCSGRVAKVVIDGGGGACGTGGARSRVCMRICMVDVGYIGAAAGGLDDVACVSIERASERAHVGIVSSSAVADLARFQRLVLVVEEDAIATDR